MCPQLRTVLGPVFLIVAALETGLKMNGSRGHGVAVVNHFHLGACKQLHSRFLNSCKHDRWLLKSMWFPMSAVLVPLASRGWRVGRKLTELLVNCHADFPKSRQGVQWGLHARSCPAGGWSGARVGVGVLRARGNHLAT